jgi:hypothetical protein
MQISEHRFQLEGLAQDYERRRAEILNRLDEQKLQHRSEITDVQYQLQINRAKFEEDFYQNRRRFTASLEQQRLQAITDREVAEEGIKAWEQVNAAKHRAREAEQELRLRGEEEQLKIRGAAPRQALLSILPPEQADRLLKLVELEMHKGLSEAEAFTLAISHSKHLSPEVLQAVRRAFSGIEKGDDQTQGVKQLPQT